MNEQDRWLSDLLQQSLAPTPTQEDRLLARLQSLRQEAPRDERVLWQSFTRLMTSTGATIRQTVTIATQIPLWGSVGLIQPV